MFVGMQWEIGIRQESDRKVTYLSSLFIHGTTLKITYLCILDYLTSFYDYFMLMHVWIIEEGTCITRT